MASPFVYEKNDTKLTVVGPTTLDVLMQELRNKAQLRELVLLEVVSSRHYFDFNDEHKGLPPLRKLRFGKEACTQFHCKDFLVHVFAFTVETIDAWRVGIPDGVCFPRLRYLRLTEGDFYFSVNRKSNFPSLTYVHIPNLPFVLPFAVLGSPIATSGNERDASYI